MICVCGHDTFRREITFRDPNAKFGAYTPEGKRYHPGPQRQRLWCEKCGVKAFDEEIDADKAREMA